MSGSFGIVGEWDGSDFGGKYGDLVVCTGTMLVESGVGFVSVGTPTISDVVDEPDGLIALNTGASSGDNCFLLGAPVIAQNGGAVLEARFKPVASTNCAVSIGYMQTLVTATPVLPATFSTVTMTYTGTGAMVGLLKDTAATTDDYRAFMGTGGAGVAGSGTTGIRANATMTGDKWITARVVLQPDGGAEVWMSDVGHVDRAGMPVLRLIKRFIGTENHGASPISVSAVLHPFLAIETRTTASKTLEVDYFKYRSFRNWAS